MAESTNIAWAKSTVNFWIGCSKVSIEKTGGGGCDGCYAEHSTPARTMKIEWGPGKPRHRTKPQTWNQLDRWNREAPTTEFAGIEGFWPVFIDSLSDFFDNEVPLQWRIDALEKMRVNSNLTFLVVTKRIGNARRMLEEARDALHGSSELYAWLDDWLGGQPPKNIWIISTVVNQPEADRDIPKLLLFPAHVRGLSIEPQLGKIDLRRVEVPREADMLRRPWDFEGHKFNALQAHDEDRFHQPPAALDWVICGGESNQPEHPAREFMLDWAGILAGDCAEAGVPFFMKQLGHQPTLAGQRYKATDKGEDPSEWPVYLRRRQYPQQAHRELACA